MSQRIATLYRLPALARGVLVVPVATLMQRLAPREFIAGASLVLRRGERIDLEAERRRLDGAGYRHVPQVLEPGDYATRGALIDIYPMGAAAPYRIELLRRRDRDASAASIRKPSARSSRSSRSTCCPRASSRSPRAATRAFRNLLRERFEVDTRRCPLYQDLREGSTPAGIEYYLPLFFERTDTLFDYLGAEAMVVLDHGALEAAAAFWASTGDRYEQRRHDVERPLLPPAELFLPPEALRERLNRSRASR